MMAQQDAASAPGSRNINVLSSVYDGGRPPASRGSNPSGSKPVKRTFTAAPKHTKMPGKNVKKQSYTHTDQRLIDIGCALCLQAASLLVGWVPAHALAAVH